MKRGLNSVSMVVGVMGKRVNTSYTPPTMTRKKAATMVDSELFVEFVFSGSLSPANVAFAAHGRPCLSLDNA